MAGWTCAACGGDNRPGARFCGQCGTAAEAAPALRSFVGGPVADRLVEAGGTLPEERRLVTALFADVSGFTLLADRLDPERLLEVIDPVIAALSSVVGRHDGYVEKFAGDALMALFGAPVSHEDDAARALRTALEMHAELARIVPSLPYEPELTLHVGVNSGHGIARILGSEARMDYAVLGDSVIIAQRLEAAAPLGETYVSETAMRLAEDAFRFELVGELQLKGKAEPVRAWRLVGERSRARARSAASLVGRGRELQSVGAALDGGVVTVTGEAGVGKSHLVEAARDAAVDAGVTWLAARCLSYGAGLAYWPYAELVRADPDASPDPYFARLLGQRADGEVEELEPEAFRRGLHTAFARWFRAHRDRGPTVLVLEDVHWADPSSLAMTRELLHTARVGMVLTGRPQAEDILAELTADAADVTSLALGPLDDDAVAAVAANALGWPPPPELIRFVVQRTDGNPFFVKELVRGLRDSGAIVAADGGWKMRSGWNESDVPPTIEGALAARIDLLPRAAATTLGTASVIGRHVPLPLLHSVAGELGLAESVERLVAAGLLDRAVSDGVEMLSFHHALVQDVAYGRLLRRHRRDLHRRVGETVEQLYGARDDVIGLLARHFYLGEAGEKAVGYLVRAGARAKQLFANEEAILHFHHASELSPDPEILLKLAELYELVGRYEEALATYSGVRVATGDVRAWRGLASTHRKKGEYLQAFNTVNEALHADELRGEDVLPLWLEGGWSLSISGRVDEAADMFVAALESAGGRREAVVGDLLLQLARTETIKGDFDAAVAHTLEAEPIFTHPDDPRGLASTMRIRGHAQAGAGQLDEASATLRRGLELARRTGGVEEIGGCLINLGIVEFDRGAFEKAIECDRQAIDEFERVGHGSGRATGYANLAHKLAHAGRVDEAQAWATRALELSDRIGHAQSRADATHTLASIHLRQGRLEEAGERFEEAAALYLEIGMGQEARTALAVAADAWGRAGESTRARSVSERARTLLLPS
jgi:class 3 adenylate cyclase/tetratricopeptide (TPR) repeat protein